MAGPEGEGQQGHAAQMLPRQTNRTEIFSGDGEPLAMVVRTRILKKEKVAAKGSAGLKV